MPGGTMRNFFAILSVALLFSFGPTARADEAPLEIQGAKTVSADTVIALIQKTKDLVILDDRSAADYEAGHIEGAVRLIDTDITSESILAQHVKAKDAPVLFYCNGVKCGRAAKATVKALGWGYNNVYYYALGMEEWKARQLPLVR
jgi:rhodanese-related sulfurtransferase